MKELFKKKKPKKEAKEPQKDYTKKVLEQNRIIAELTRESLKNR